MNREEWLAKRNNDGSLRKFQRIRGVIAHTSVSFIRNPLAVQTDLASAPFDGPQFVRFGKPSTLDVGSNALKRRDRKVHVAMRVDARSIR